MAELRHKLSDWVKPEVLIVGIPLLVAVILAYADIKSDVRNTNTMIQQDRDARRERDTREADERLRLESRVSNLEQGRATDRETMIEIKTIVKRIDERVPGKP